MHAVPPTLKPEPSLVKLRNDNALDKAAKSRMDNFPPRVEEPRTESAEPMLE